MSSDESRELDHESGGSREPLTKKGRRRRAKRTVKPEPRRQLSGAQKVMILDCMRRSELSVTDFAAVCGITRETLYSWRRKFEEEGPAGLEAKPRGQRGSRLPEETKRAILMMKESQPSWGSQRICDVLKRSEGFSASPGAIQRVLLEAGYVVDTQPSRAHPDKKRRFERARPNQLWQSDLFSFTLKRTGRRVALVAFLDDHSRLVTGHMLAASATSTMVKEALLQAIARHGSPEELLTDNGPPYGAWRGTTSFSHLLRKRGIAHVRSRPRNPQTCGKIERFWQSLWQECLEDAPMAGLDEARDLIARYIDRYNFLRPHQGIGGLVPADRFFSAGSSARVALEERVRQREEEGAVSPLYLAGRIGDQTVSLHSEDERLVLVDEDGSRREVSLAELGKAKPAPQEPGAGAPSPPMPERDASATEPQQPPERAVTEPEMPEAAPADARAPRPEPAQQPALVPAREAEQTEPEVPEAAPAAGPKPQLQQPPDRAVTEPEMPQAALAAERTPRSESARQPAFVPAREAEQTEPEVPEAAPAAEVAPTEGDRPDSPMERVMRDLRDIFGDSQGGA